MSTDSGGLFDREPTRLKTINATRAGVQRILLQHLPRRVDRAVEVGCGSGFFYRLLLPPPLRRNYIGVDIHTPSLERFKTLAPQAQVQQGDLEDLPFDDSSVDVLFGYSAYPLFYPQTERFEEAKRVLKAGCKIAIFQDSGMIGDRAFLGAKMSARDGAKEVERCHSLLLKAVVRHGFRIVSGRDFLQTTAVSPFQKMIDRFSTEELSKLIQQTSMGAVFFGQSLDRGISTAYTSPPSAIKTNLANLQMMLDVPPQLLNFNIRPGKDVFEFSRMRYIIAEKPAA